MYIILRIQNSVKLVIHNWDKYFVDLIKNPAGVDISKQHQSSDFYMSFQAQIKYCANDVLYLHKE